MLIGKEGSVKHCLGALTAWYNDKATTGFVVYRPTDLELAVGDRCSGGTPCHCGLDSQIPHRRVHDSRTR
jgi:hypothetical protein